MCAARCTEMMNKNGSDGDMKIQGWRRRWDCPYHLRRAFAGMRAIDEAMLSEKMLLSVFEDGEGAEGEAQMFDQCVRRLKEIFPRTKCIVHGKVGG